LPIGHELTNLDAAGNRDGLRSGEPGATGLADELVAAGITQTEAAQEPGDAEVRVWPRHAPAVADK
jgi:hypothetical protein